MRTLLHATVILAAATHLVAPAGVPSGPCRQSELTCGAAARHRCVTVTKFCDGVDDCGDGTDEPRSCTPCNRTYTGDLGKTYQLSVHRPREDRLPFICDLNFKAPGGEYGDIVQLTFDSFTLGRFTSWTQAGCPDGDLQISESPLERPLVGGRWCGTAWGPPSIYYSETGSVTLHLRLLRVPSAGNNIPLGSSGAGMSSSMGYNFDFSVGFKVLSRDSAVVRFGGAAPASPGRPFQNVTTAPPLFTKGERKRKKEKDREVHKEQLTYNLGDLIPGTYCSRIYSDCDKKLCRLQSPNFPGLYPRNVTCYYAVRQQKDLAGTHALISISQPSGQLVAIRSQSSLPGSSRPADTMPITAEAGRTASHSLKTWNECDEVQDYVTIYDGYTTRDPILMRFCGGGQAVPPAVSSGPELLVEFTSSPYGTFLAPQGAGDQMATNSFPSGGVTSALHGFQLDVEVKFVPLHTPTYARNKRCEFWIRQSTELLPNGRSDTGGRLENPKHSLAPNTTCLYHISAAEVSSKVWISMLKYHVDSSLDPKYQVENCSAELRIWDGDVAVPIKQHCDSGPFCERTRYPGSLTATANPGSGFGKNVSLLAHYCKDLDDKSCEHLLLANGTRSPRPCRVSSSESFVSSGASVTIELRLQESTTLRPVRFVALYEFVDPRLDGEPFGTGPCDRRFVSRHKTGPVLPSNVLVPFRDMRENSFRSSKDIFLFGRGGARHLKCRFRFEAELGERVKLTITRLATGPGRCQTVLDPVVGRHRCIGNRTATVMIHEVPWNQHQEDAVLVPRECACSSEVAPLIYVSTSHSVEIVLEANDMGPHLDYDDVMVEGRYEFIATPACTRSRKVTGPSGDITFRSPSITNDEIYCENYPWMVEPANGKYLYVKVRGHLMPDPLPTPDANDTNNLIFPRLPAHNCLTKNRLVIYSSGKLRALVCPMSFDRDSMVQVFSEGWEMHENISVGLDETKRRLLVEFVAREPGSYSVSWLEVSPIRKRQGPAILPPAGFVMGNTGGEDPFSPNHCSHRCPELQACINSSLFCDGVVHCPSGFDEASESCAPYFLRLPQLLYLLVVVAALTSLCVALGVSTYKACYRRRKKQARLRLLLPSGSSGKDLSFS
ncbi:uncharacterized protein LOC132200435 isoform X2 [Neocloeon triangulifer]|uniref:uncharacterized protein LOC132200435 isoform X2 n=1 Tax=Neocloeon triangulifer TaxID=2078957 RepID=UPI00286F3624|nr:uncharacterized protein LOC132200435 isoform X2 [Neocloeon triangulifer]